MYQTRTKSNEENFNKLIEAFYRTVIPAVDIEKDTSRWDLNRTYKPNHACIWNNPNNVGRECIVLEKTDELALVLWKDSKGIPNDELLSSVYRLEDLSIA